MTPLEKAQLEALRDQCAAYCRVRRGSGEAFVPVGFGGRPDGRVTMVGGPFMPDLVENPVMYVYEEVASIASGCSAIAVAESAGEPQTPYFRIMCEHRAAGAYHVSVPWSIDASGGIQMGVPIIETTGPVFYRHY